MFIEEQIIFEDNHLIVLNKRPGQLVQGDKTGDEPLSETLKTFLKQKYNKPGNIFIGVAHRLDRPCSGVVVFAKTSKALERMNQIFRDKTTLKKYLAITENKPNLQAGTLTNFLKKNEKQNKSYIVDGPANKHIKEAILHYKHIASGDNYALLEIELVTGRHHQIRVQLAGMNCPIKGDLKYGASRSNKDGSIHLHAHCLRFVHPVRKELMEFRAFPNEKDVLWKLFSEYSRMNVDEGQIIVQNEAGCVMKL